MGKRIAIVGAGAAGCFAACLVREALPEAETVVFEAGKKPMAKLSITGGGRCNLTNSFQGIRSLSEAYPRGGRLMKRLLKAFSQDDIREWFLTRGVPTLIQEDQCCFPVSQDAMDIVNCLYRGMQGADIRCGVRVRSIDRQGEAYVIEGECFDRVLVTTGGASGGMGFLSNLGIEVVTPVPSLFTFEIASAELRSLMGLVVNASVSIPSTSFRAGGPLLITDWGISGPATLKLSSYAARYLADSAYKCEVSINWMEGKSQDSIKSAIVALGEESPRKTLANTPLLSHRLWAHIISRAGLRRDIRWAELGSKGLNHLVQTLSNDIYKVEGKGKFRDEFVTAGGVSLSSINPSTLESKTAPGLYFAGEVLDIDAITGGFNLQAAWSTGFVAAKAVISSLQS